MVGPLLARAAAYVPALGPALKGAGNKAFRWITQNKKRVAGASAVGSAGGTFTLTTVADALGITTERLDTIIRIGAVLAAVVALGQLFNINLGGE